MKEGLHPKYELCAVTCACGNTFTTRSTKPEIKLEICSACHPFFTGKQKFVDRQGRIDVFLKKFEQAKLHKEKVAQTKKAQAAKARLEAAKPVVKKAKTLTTRPVTRTKTAS